MCSSLTTAYRPVGRKIHPSEGYIHDGLAIFEDVTGPNAMLVQFDKAEIDKAVPEGDGFIVSDDDREFFLTIAQLREAQQHLAAYPARY